jgi:hypothetical protein
MQIMDVQDIAEAWKELTRCPIQGKLVMIGGV